MAESGAHVGMHSDHTFGGGQEQRAAADIGDIVLGAGRVVDRIAPPLGNAAFKPNHQVSPAWKPLRNDIPSGAIEAAIAEVH